jgi:hypothetical protein
MIHKEVAKIATAGIDHEIDQEIDQEIGPEIDLGICRGHPEIDQAPEAQIVSEIVETRAHIPGHQAEQIKAKTKLFAVCARKSVIH